MTTKLILTNIIKKKNSTYLSVFSKNLKNETLKFNDIIFKDIILKKKKDYLYLKNINNKILKILKIKLNRIFRLKKSDIYWRILVYPWICHYTAFFFSKWKIAKFLKRTKKKFQVEDYVSENYVKVLDHSDYINKYVLDDYYNFYQLKKIFNFIGLKNIVFVKKTILNDSTKTKKNHFLNFNLFFISLKNFILKIIFFYFIKNSKIYFDNFYFPKKKFYSLCLKLKILPLLDHSFILPRKSLNINTYNAKLRNEIKIYATKYKTKDFFLKFLLDNISLNIPMSYIENYPKIQSSIENFSKIKKNIITTSLFYNDILKIYCAEAVSNGSKLIFIDHGIQTTKFSGFFNYQESISHKFVIWNKRLKSDKTIYLPPTLPIINKEINIKSKKRINCTIIFTEAHKYLFKMQSTPSLYNSIFEFKAIVSMVKLFDKKIRNVIKFRNKNYSSFNATKRFEKIFGKNAVDTPKKNSFFETLKNSKLIIFTYAQTAFFESMFLNTPTILILFKDHWDFEEKFKKYVNLFLKNNIAFYDIKNASNFINNNWDRLSDWWNSTEIQKSREEYIFDYTNYREDYLSKYESFFKKLIH